MSPDSLDASALLLNARLAIRRGDLRDARRWAEKAVAFDPELVDAWLILAGVASPRASIIYLQHALRLDPDNQLAKEGMIWAQERLASEEEKKEQKKEAGTPVESPPQEPPLRRKTPPRIKEDPGATQPIRMAPVTRLGSIGDTQPTRRVSKTSPGSRTKTRKPPSTKKPGKPQGKFRWSILLAFIPMFCVISLAAYWAFGATAALPFPWNTPVTPVMSGVVDISKPTYTSSPTATFTPSPTSTPTDTPTETPTFTLTPSATNTPRPSSTPFLPSSGVKWIDVNLSQQMVYAYEGETIVASFLVSTGVPAYPTVVGQFYIYIKLESTLMTGDGYYLPNVPYTMYFYRGYGLHGTYWHNNFGTPMSHGCVNMYTPDAQWLFYWAPLGTLVNVHY